MIIGYEFNQIDSRGFIPDTQGFNVKNSKMSNLHIDG